MAALKQKSKHISAEDILKNLPLLEAEKSQLNHEIPDQSSINKDGSDLDNVDTMKQSLRDIPRGKPKSGRQWKTTRSNRFSSMKLDKTLKTSWQIKMKRKAELKSIKNYEKELKEAKAKEQEARRLRQEQNRKKKEEMQRKAEVVQVIRDTRKIKKMKKKQLRMIEKR